jgi:hypothetical protein
MKNTQQVARMAQVRKQKIQLMNKLESKKQLSADMKRKLISKKGMRW